MNEIESTPVLSSSALLPGHSLLSMIDSTEWAIMPEKLEQIRLVVMQHIAGTNIAIQPDASDMYSTGGVAVIPVIGTLTKRAYGLSAMSGIRTMGNIRADIQEAIDNPEISGIVLDIDSPGGTVDGTKELADFVAAAKQVKPIIAYANGLAASAAYWLASACTSVSAYDTTQVGSIGVVVQHTEHSEAAKQAGVKETFIYRGQYKTVGNRSEPLSDGAKARIQARVDTYYGMFVDAICNHRGLDKETVLESIATGETFIAAEALKLGLIDSIGDLTSAIELAKQQGEVKMTEKITAETLDQLKASMVDMQASMTAMQFVNEKLTTENEKLAGSLAAKVAEDEAAKVLADVAVQFADCQLADGSVAVLAKLDAPTLAVIHTEISGRQVQIDATLKELGKTNSKSTTKHNEKVISSVDEAVAAIMTRDKCDIETAMDLAQTEYSDLFKM